MSDIGVAYEVRPASLPDFELGACAGKAHLMDPAPTNRRAINRAKDLCERCPVIAECFAWMVTLDRRDDPHGVLGGVTWEERTGRDPLNRMCRGCFRVLPQERFAMTGPTQRAQCKTCVAAARARATRTEEAA